jgi:hypothetical protein
MNFKQLFSIFHSFKFNSLYRKTRFATIKNIYQPNVKQLKKNQYDFSILFFSFFPFLLSFHVSSSFFLSIHFLYVCLFFYRFNGQASLKLFRVNKSVKRALSSKCLSTTNWYFGSYLLIPYRSTLINVFPNTSKLSANNKQF